MVWRGLKQSSCRRWSWSTRLAVASPSEGLKDLRRRGRHRPGAAGCRIHQNRDGSGDGGASAVLEERLRERDRRSPDALDTRADIDRAGPMQFAQIVELKTRQHELRQWRLHAPHWIGQECQPPALATDGKDGAGDMAVAIRVGEPKRLDDAMRKLVQARRPRRWTHGATRPLA